MNVWWHLVWLIPAMVGIGVVFACFWPFGKGPEGPPYAGFDPGENATGTTMNDQAAMYEAGLKIFEPGDPPGIYGYRHGDQIHRQLEAYQQFVVDAVPDPVLPYGMKPMKMANEDSHPGYQCSPACWRKPNGHRWETS